MSLEVIFPDPNEAEDDGLVAVGGELSVEYLIAAYSQGVFPWFSEGEPILWWSPNPRMILFPHDFKCSDSLKQLIKRGKFEVKADEAFLEVIRHCANSNRKDQNGTWITSKMQEAYINLHNQGYAHSFEAYENGKLVGGLYGVSLGKGFFGESMFYNVANASKVAFYYLVQTMIQWNFDFIDAQQSTNHLKSLGAKDIDRKLFMELLNKTIKYPTIKGKWQLDF
jgi:leucyl/phenylalanyl-tRNA---protein transferase